MKKIVSIYIVLITFILLFVVQPYWGVWGMFPIAALGYYLYQRTKGEEI